MMSVPAELLLYQQLDEIHERMKNAAIGLQWNEAIGLQGEVDKIVSELAHYPQVLLNPEQRRYKAKLIQQILEKQAFVKQEISDWQSDVEPLLSRRRNVEPDEFGPNSK